MSASSTTEWSFFTARSVLSLRRKILRTSLLSSRLSGRARWHEQGVGADSVPRRNCLTLPAGQGVRLRPIRSPVRSHGEEPPPYPFRAIPEFT